jgi:hypothetical protein
MIKFSPKMHFFSGENEFFPREFEKNQPKEESSLGKFPKRGRFLTLFSLESPHFSLYYADKSLRDESPVPTSYISPPICFLPRQDVGRNG